MKILVANLGSTSFKYRLFDVSDETELARGAIDRIGGAESLCRTVIGSHSEECRRHVADHAAAVQICLDRLTCPDRGCLDSAADVGGIGFKAVFAGRLSGVRLVDEELLDAMERLSVIAPAHNPPYVRAMRQLQEAFPEVPLVAALETAFHETIPFEHRAYAVPWEWYTDGEIRRWGYHGASHRWVAGRTADLCGRDDLRVISCHLGGSASVCAIRDGKSVATSMGMSPQGGLPNANRVGDFDAYAIPLVMQSTGLSFEEVLQEMSVRGGLLGISGLSGDCRDLEQAAAEGHERAELALRLFEASVRSFIGSYLVLLGGLDVLVFTGGIGEHSVRVRSQVCRDLQWLGPDLCPQRNAAVRPGQEQRISTDTSQTEVWVIPANEELVVARQTADLLTSQGG